jgi:hypothetical protein
MTGDPTTEPRRRGAWAVFLDAWVAPYVRDPTLWPVLIVVIVHVIAFLAPALLLSVRDRELAAAVTLAAAACVTGLAFVQEIRHRGRPGELAGVLVITWIASAAVAWLADAHALF